MKLLRKFNWTLAACALCITGLFVIDTSMLGAFCCGFSVATLVADTMFHWKTRQRGAVNLPGFYILILLACIVVGFAISGRFGDKLHDKAEDVKNIYTNEEKGETEDEQER